LKLTLKKIFPLRFIAIKGQYANQLNYLNALTIFLVKQIKFSICAIEYFFNALSLFKAMVLIS